MQTASEFEAWLNAPEPVKTLPPDPRCANCHKAFKRGKGERNKYGTADAFCCVDCQEALENPRCFQCHKQFRSGTGAGSEKTPDAFCGVACQDECFPQELMQEFKQAAGRAGAQGVSTQDLVARAEVFARRASEEYKLYVPVTLQNGTSVMIVPNDLLPKTLPNYINAAAVFGEKPTCSSCGTQVELSLTRSDKWMPVEEVGELEYETHFALCPKRIK